MGKIFESVGYGDRLLSPAFSGNRGPPIGESTLEENFQHLGFHGCG
ncbi:MAG: hypothetical protein LBN94_00590 [Puniceicoccales bacterium]|nr:hypothetical protein [Puniceicoccales bacterium]